MPSVPFTPIVVADPAGVAGDLAAALPGYVHHVQSEPVIAAAQNLGARTVHLVVPDDGSDAPIDPPPQPSDAYRDAIRDAEQFPESVETVVLDGCYQPELADRLAVSGISVLGLPGRLGRERATAFAVTWYSAARTMPPREAFDEALAATGLHHLPDQLQPHWHDRDPAARAVFRGPADVEPTKVTVWYGTNRQPSDDADYYTAEPDDQLHLGRCVVHVPASVPVGRLRGRRSRRGTEPSSYQITEHETLDTLTLLREGLEAESVGRRSALVYIHGYKTRFKEAVTRAAQLHSDLKYPGTTAAFSWPSQGTANGYWADEEAVQHAERYLLQFLTQLHDDVHPERIDILAHSMGNRAMLRVAMRIADALPHSTDLRLGNVILAAADVGRRFFTTEAPAYPRISDTVTAYTGAADRALQASRIMHHVARAGLTPPLTLVDGITTIETTDLDLDLLGHSYYAQAREVLADINAVLYGRHDPQSRVGLAQAMDSPTGKPYWKFRP
ncbi:alpha/beta hydrolase [Paractinoplanes tereljensis]|uniref:alpha/beta hydrolase n=1 Tax=Paractinoplanes tereljensis TaxID=571912 RepID=UPI001EF28A81|nr:alpha/beta hydrolase [Actinoplanes tereljensis]